MNLSGLTAVTTAAEMKAWLSANCLSPISPVMTGTDLGIIMQKVMDVTEAESVGVLNGTSDPGSGIGIDGDFYINTSTSMLFGPKVSGSWPAGVSLVGAAGATGPGVPTGGAAGQVLAKIDGINYNSHWIDPNYVPLAGGTMTGFLTLSGNPTSAMHAATKNYVDNYIAGLQFIDVAAKVASPKGTNISISSAPASLDGVTGVAGDRWLLKDQTNGAENGVYVFNGAGSALTRAVDAATGAQLANKTIPVSQGATQADTWWTVTNDTIIIGTTALTIVQTAGAGTYAAGTGLTLSGNLFGLDTSYTKGLLSATAPIFYNSSTGIMSSQPATSSQNGYLTSTDWGTFNSKQPAMSGTGYTKFSGSTITYNATIPNSDLTSSSITIQGTSVPLGGSVSPINGTGFVKASGTTISYDNNTYLNITGGTLTGTLNSRAILPTTDNTYILGSPSFRWNGFYSANATINTLMVPNNMFVGTLGGGSFGVFLSGGGAGNTGQIGIMTSGIGTFTGYNIVLPNGQATAPGNVMTYTSAGSPMVWSDLNNYAFTSPTATTQAAHDNSNKIATTAYADAAVSSVIAAYVPYTGATGAVNLGVNTLQSGNIGAGSAPGSNTVISSIKNVTGNVNQLGVDMQLTAQSDVTTAVYGFRSTVNTAAAAFTIPNVWHFHANGVQTVGAGSTVTTQFGFYVPNNLTNASNNYGFYGNIPTGTNRYNLYMNGTAPNFLQGGLGVGMLPSSDRGITVGSTLSSATSYGLVLSPIANSTVTTAYYGIYSNPSSVAATYTLGSALHFVANATNLGSGATLTNQYGFVVNSTMNSATNNYGFYGNLTAASNTYNLYMNGSAMNYMNGNLGIGSLPISHVGLFVNNTSLPASSNQAYGIVNQSTYSSSVTSLGESFTSSPLTAAASFTIPNFHHFQANGIALGAGSAVTNQMGFSVQAAMTNAANNYGFYGSIPTGTNNNYNLYMAGTAMNFLQGNLGIGTLPQSHIGLSIGATLTGSTGAYGVDSRIVLPSSVTATPVGFRSAPSTVAAAFTVANMIHFLSNGVALGAGSAVTSQYGFYADGTLNTAANNYGFYGAVANNAGSYNLYMAGTAMNYLNGNLGLGTLPVNNVGVLVQRSLATGSVGMSVQDTIQSAVTASYNSYRTIMVTQAAAFTLNNAYHYIAQQGTLGAGSSITNQYGFYADSTIIGGTNNYGFYGNIAAGTGRWNLYMNGTADNYIAGKLGIGTTSLSAKLNLGAATSAQASLNIASGTLLTTPVSGAIEYDGTNLYFTDNTPTRQTIATYSSSPVIRAKADLTGQTAGGNIVTYTVGSTPTTFEISVYVSVTAIATDVIEVIIDYTDKNGNARTIAPYGLISATGSTNYSPITIIAKNGTVITVRTVLTTTGGSITFDAGARIISY